MRRLATLKGAAFVQRRLILELGVAVGIREPYFHENALNEVVYLATEFKSLFLNRIDTTHDLGMDSCQLIPYLVLYLAKFGVDLNAFSDRRLHN